MKTREQEHTPNKLDVALGLRIRQRRKSLGVSQTALADSIGLTFQQIQKYERGFNRVSFSRLVDIAHALNCRVIDLIGDLDDAGIPSPLFRQDTAHLRESGPPSCWPPTPPRRRPCAGRFSSWSSRSPRTSKRVGMTTKNRRASPTAPAEVLTANSRPTRRRPRRQGSRWLWQLLFSSNCFVPTQGGTLMVITDGRCGKGLRLRYHRWYRAHSPPEQLMRREFPRHGDTFDTELSSAVETFPNSGDLPLSVMTPPRNPVLSWLRQR